MALLFLGKSRCTICNDVILKENNVNMFRHFVPESHKLWKYSDSSMHKSCFNDWKFKNEFLDLYFSVTGKSYF